jgi:hypothetical protein
LEFKFQGSERSFDFKPVNTDSDLLSGFERRTERVVGDDEKAAIQDALSTGYSVEFGYWGRTMRVPIRGETINCSSAEFKTFINAIKPSTKVMIVEGRLHFVDFGRLEYMLGAD